MKDKIQITFAILLVVAGLGAFYGLSEQPTILRVLAMLGCFVAAGVAGWYTQPGREFGEYTKESIEEARKVVWPTRKETMQSTGVIFVFVFVMALFLWGTDTSLSFVLSKFLGHGGA